ncbi:MAG: cysteine peptidase family C39 domain-containing protein [Bacteroidota bacterium]|nr:cysteine peptidase family C39 domain-containing protein [Bacteroidota bacterium]
MSKQHLIDTLFTALARGEEQLYSNATLLSNFSRSVQIDQYSCGAKSTYMVLKYFGKRCTHESVERQLGTTIEGTSRKDIKRVLKEYGLNIQVNSNMGIRDLKSAIKTGSPVIVSLYSNCHYSVVYGFSDTQIFVMNPSLGEMGSIKITVRKSEWREIFDRWGVVVSKK